MLKIGQYSAKFYVNKSWRLRHIFGSPCIVVLLATPVPINCR